MRADIGYGTDGGRCAFGLEAVIFPPDGNFLQRSQIGVKQQRAVVQQPPSRRALGAAGDFFLPDSEVTGAVFPRGNVASLLSPLKRSSFPLNSPKA